jgi:hypothetical protein
MVLPAKVSQERRKTPRTILAEILYIHLEVDNGGIVLNVSKEGLAFCPAIPFQRQGPIRFWFLSPEGGRIEGSGELVWVQDDKKKAGLRFTDLLPAMHIHLNDLVGVPGPASSRPRIEIEPRERAGRTGSQPIAPQIAQERQAFEFPPTYAADLDANGPSAARPVPEEPRPLIGQVLAGLSIIAFFITLGYWLYFHRQEAGAAMIRWGEQLEGSSIPQRYLVMFPVVGIYTVKRRNCWPESLG